jgi:hypothetical protein
MLYRALIASALSAFLVSTTLGVAQDVEKRAVVPRAVLGPLEIPNDPYIPISRASQPRSPAFQIRSTEFFTTQVNVDQNGDNIVGDAANEPTIAIDPTDPRRMAIGWRQFDTIASDFRQAGYGYSTDSGQTWTFPGVIEPGIFRSDPVLDVDSDGTFYFNSLTTDWTDYWCHVFRSSNGGAGWDEGTYAHGGDKQWMSIDRSGNMGDGHIYAYWTSYYSVCYPGFFTRSIDGGDSFEDCEIIPDDPSWGTIAVGPDGELYIVGEGYGGFVVAKSTTAQDPGEPVAWDFTRSVDLDGYLGYGGGPNPGGLLGQAWIAVDESDGPTRGNVYVMASVVRSSSPDPLDVMFSRSMDGGLTWSPVIKLNDDPGTNAYQWFGTMSVAPNGRIDVIWLDTRDDPGGYDSSLYFTYSEDAGITWSPNERMTESFDPHVGWPQQDKLGDYFHMRSDVTGAHLAWAGTFNGEQDVYYSKIQVAADRLAGTVRNASDQNPIAGAVVQVLETDDSGVSDDTGHYSIWNNFPDAITVAVTRFGFVPDTAQVVVTHNDTTIHDVSLEPLNPGTLNGNVTDLETGEGIQATVSVVYLGTPVLQTETNPVTGFYEFILPEGTYDVRVVPDLPYLPDTRQDIVVTESQVTELDFTLLSVATFAEVSEAAGVDNAGFGQGTAWGDFDGDGLPDLYVANLSGPNALYHNLGGGLFEDVTTSSGTGDAASSFSCVWADYDKDGDQDLYVANRNAANRLYRNNGNGTFTDVAVSAGVAGGTAYSQGAAWADYDKDGDIDLYVANRFSLNFLFSNDGDGTFTDMAGAAGMTAAGPSRGAAWADYDDDGDQDLFVSVNGAANILYRNQGNGTFVDVAPSLGLDDAGAAAGVAWGDVDGDLDLDLFVANDGSESLLYLNEGGAFVEAASAAGLDYDGTSRCPTWGDLDKDGDLDLLLTTGTGALCFVNDGAGQFTDVSSGVGLLDSSLGEGAAVADMDGDGDLDYYVARSQFAPNRLYENDGNIYHFLGVNLAGRLSNKDAIGARITVTVNGRSMVEEVSGGSGFYSMDEHVQLFGLGPETIADEVRIEWPSGRVQILTNIAADQVIGVTERGTLTHKVAFPL